MAGVRHSVRRQTLRVTVASESLAFAVRPRLEALNHSAFLPIIERVFDEFAGTDRHLRLERLDVDLGWMLASDLERVAPDRFEQALREQLLLAFHGNGGAAVRAQTPAEAGAEALERLLLTGTLPFWATHEPPQPEAALIEWMASEPAAVRTLFRCHRRNDLFLRRIVLTLSDDGLAQLLRTLTPEDAATIIAYLAGIRALHRVRPVIPVTDAALGHIVWGVTLAYVVNDTGSQFNRKSFVRALLSGVAESERLTYRDVLRIFDLGLPGPAIEAPIAAPLLDVVAALVDDERRADPRFDGAASWRLPGYQREDVRFDVPFRYDVADALRYYLRFGDLPWSIRLRHPHVSLADYVMQLPALPPALIDSLIDDLPVEDWHDRWLQLLDHLSEGQLETLAGAMATERPQLRALLTTAAVPGLAPRRTVLLRAIAADLAAAPELPLETGPDLPRPSFSLIAVPDAAHLVRSLLTARLLGPVRWPAQVPGAEQAAAAGAESTTPAEPGGSATMRLGRLVDEHPADTKAWLRELQRAGHSPAALIDATPDMTTLDAVRRRLSAPSADVVRIVIATLAALPVAERTYTDGQLRRILLEELLTAWSSDMPPRRLQERLFARLFPETAGPAGEVVRDVVARLADQGAIARSTRQLFDNAAGPIDTSGAAAGGTAPPSAATAEDLDTGALARWLGGIEDGRDRHIADGYDRDTLNDALKRLTTVPSALVSSVSRQLSDARARRRWVREMSESNRARVFGVLAAGDGGRLLDAAERLFAGWRTTAGRGERRQRERLWLFLFEFLATTPPSARTLAQLTRQFFGFAGEVHRAASGTGSASPPHAAAAGAASAPGERTWRGVMQRAERDGDAGLQQVLRRDRELLRQAWEGTAGSEAARTPPESRPRARTAFSMDDSRDADGGEPIYIANAGLVIAAPFLPRLFQALELTEINAAGKPRIQPALLSRAVHLLQWVVTGRTDTPEPALCLNKLLCGVAVAVPVEPAIAPTPRELEIGTTLLNSIIANWTIIENTSIDGLRETFLQRDGRLERIAHGWRLEVQRKTLDVLLDQLPWSVSTVMHSLMVEPIFVKW